jgi:hypothetical protein
VENGRTERQIEFIVATLADLAVNDQKHDHRLSRLERVAKLMVKADLRERKNRSEADERLTTALTDLAEAQKEDRGLNCAHR